MHYYVDLVKERVRPSCDVAIPVMPGAAVSVSAVQCNDLLEERGCPHVTRITVIDVPGMDRAYSRPWVIWVRSPWVSTVREQDCRRRQGDSKRRVS